MYHKQYNKRYIPSIPNWAANSVKRLPDGIFHKDFHSGLLLSATVYARKGCCFLLFPSLLPWDHDDWGCVDVFDWDRDDNDLGGYGGGDGLIDSDCVPAGRVATAMAACSRMTIMVIICYLNNLQSLNWSM